MGFNLGSAIKSVFSNPVKLVTNPTGTIASAIGAPKLGAAIDPMGAVRGNIANRIAGKSDEGSMPGYAQGDLLNPAQQAAARDSDIATGQQRFRDMMAGDQNIQDIIKRRKDGSQGLNAQENMAAREQMITGSQQQQQGLMRNLLAQQNRSGVKGGLASGQQMGMAQGFAQQRADQERKLLLDNIAIKNAGLDKYQDVVMGQKFGELSQGLGEAGLGMSDRTGYQQAQIGQAMAAAANQPVKRGLLGDIFGGLF